MMSLNLDSTRVGCTDEDMFANYIAFSDDIHVIRPSISGLNVCILLWLWTRSCFTSGTKKVG